VLKELLPSFLNKARGESLTIKLRIAFDRESYAVALTPRPQTHDKIVQVPDFGRFLNFNSFNKTRKVLDRGAPLQKMDKEVREHLVLENVSASSGLLGGCVMIRHFLEVP
jgi:hypothetical protein